MKKFELEIDLRLCQEVPPPEGEGDEGGGTGSSGSGDDQGAGNEGTTPGEGDNDGGGGAAGDSTIVIKPIIDPIIGLGPFGSEDEDEENN